MLKSKADYKRVSRLIIKAQNKIKMEKMATGLLQNNKRDFWQEVRNMSVSHRGYTNTIDGVSGEASVCDTFRNKYQALYTSVPYDKNAMANIVKDVNQSVENNCSTGKCSVTHDVCVKDVFDAIHKMKMFKTDANFELYSNNLLYGSNVLCIHLSFLFNCMLKHGISPDSMNISTLIPIPKSAKKSAGDSSNYRAIALGSVIGKVLDNIIMSTNIDTLCSSELQFGFKPKHSTTQCTFVLQEIIDLYRRNDSSLYLVMLDASQAFDRVEYCKLFDVLIKRKVCSCSVRLLISMYTSQRLRVKWAHRLSDSFDCLNGVKQGGVLSPILFCIYMDELLTRLSRTGVGCHIGTRFCGALCYADDLTLLCPSRRSMSIMLKVCEQFSSEFGLKFNSTKSVLVTYNVNTDVTFQLNNVPIDKADNAVHLGHHIGKDFNQKNTSSGINNLIIRTNTMLTRFGYCSTSIKSSLFNTFCTSFYGCVLWKLDCVEIDRFYVTWRKSVRRLLSLPYRTHCNLLPALMDVYPIDIQLMLRFSKFLHNVQDSNNCLISMCAKLCNCSNTNVACNKRILYRLLETNETYLHGDVSSVNDKIKNKYHCSTQVNCSVSLIKELCDMRDNIFSCRNFNSNEIKTLLDYICCM